jgi:hypothetical protein
VDRDVFVNLEMRRSKKGKKQPFSGFTIYKRLIGQPLFEASISAFDKQTHREPSYQVDTDAGRYD